MTEYTTLEAPLAIEVAIETSETAPVAAASEPPPAPDPFLHAARVAVLASLRTAGQPVDETAATLRMSRRTMQRELARRGTSYSALRDDLRREIAAELLQREARGVDVALALGYGNPSAFHRAFRRWTGTTPRRFAADLRDAVLT